MTQLLFEFNFPGTVGSGMTYNVGSLTFIPYNIRDSISFNTVNMIAIRAAANRTLSMSLGLYSLNVGTLSIANSASGSYVGLTNAVGGYFSLATSATQNITPGTWYFGVLVSSAGGTASLFGQDTFLGAANAFPLGFIGGSMTVSTAALPATVATSDVGTTGQAALNVPHIIISA